MDCVEEAGDVELLGAETGFGASDDFLGHAEALSGRDACGDAGNTETKLIVGSEGVGIDTGGGVEHSRGVGGVDLERGVVGGDDGPGWGEAEVVGDSDGEGGAFVGVGGGAKFVEQDECCALVGLGGERGEAGDVGDVRGEGGERLLNGLGVADVG